jgi:hypothetical protein
MKMLVGFKADKGNAIHYLKFFIIEYNFHGDVVGDIRPVSSEIMLCSNSPEDGLLMARFGITYKNK